MSLAEAIHAHRQSPNVVGSGDGNTVYKAMAISLLSTSDFAALLTTTIYT